MQQNHTVSFEFATNQVRQRGDKIREWAAQNDNLLLKSLASEVLAVAGGAGK